MASEHYSFTLTPNQPLIGIPFEENGQEVVRYFSEEAQADQAVSKDATQQALDLAGSSSRSQRFLDLSLSGSILKMIVTTQQSF